MLELSHVFSSSEHQSYPFLNRQRTTCVVVSSEDLNQSDLAGRICTFLASIWSHLLDLQELGYICSSVVWVVVSFLFCVIKV